MLAVKLVAVLEDIADEEFCRKSFFKDIAGVAPPEDTMGSVPETEVTPEEVTFVSNCVCMLLVTPSV